MASSARHHSRDIGHRSASIRQTAYSLDIGTNGEMVLAHAASYGLTSTAAGPGLFEGVNIECGMQRGAWAVDTVSATDVHTISDAPAIGICGTDSSNLVSCLVRSGAIGKNGRFEREKQCPR